MFVYDWAFFGYYLFDEQFFITLLNKIVSSLLSAFQQMGFRFSPTFVQNLLAKYDPKTRRLSLDNFIVACVQIQRLTTSFKTRDREMRGQATMAYEDFVGIALGAHNWFFPSFCKDFSSILFLTSIHQSTNFFIEIFIYFLLFLDWNHPTFSKSQGGLKMHFTASLK